MKRKNTKSPVESFLALSDAQKRAVSSEYDQEFVIDKFRALTPAQRRRWRRIKRKMGRPINGQGHRVISVSMEKGLLARVDALAKRQRMTRAALIAQSLETILKTAG